MNERLNLDAIPNHIALVMDGNGRWAERRGMKRTEGHAAGEEALFDTVKGGVELGVGWMTVYAFSTENWKRPLDEVKYLMQFNESLMVRRSEELNEMNVRIRFAGRRNWRVPRRLIKRMDESIELTRNNTGMTFTIAFNYGGRAEIIDAMQLMVADMMEKGTPPDKITEKKLREYFYDSEMPDVDLMVRTSGEFRISNFLLWEIAYSELIFTETLWPDFRREHLQAAILEFQERDRRFGGLNS
ncbi:MAG: undecaprenyl diphosphate synthase [Candidatus Poriferisodalaceae bacterium]|jgi:undecaprenyl diphosphate synthase